MAEDNNLPMPTREELEAAFGGKPTPTREELEAAFGARPATSHNDWKRQAASFATGVGEVVPFGQDIPAAIGAGLSEVGLGPRYVPTEGSFADRFTAAKNAQRRAAEVMGKEAPGAQLAGNVTGLVGTIAPISRVAAPVEAAIASRVGNIAGMGASGSAIGAAQGFGEGTTLDERLNSAKTGAIVGGGLGAAVPAVAGGVRSVARGVRGAFSPSTKVDQLAAKDVARGMRPLTEEEIAAAQANNQPLRPIDLGGKALHEEARRAANVSDDASSELTTALRERQGEQQNRYVDYLSGLSRDGGLDAAGVVDRLREEARALNKPAYEKAYAAGASGVWSPELFQLTNAPSIKRAIPDAVEKLQERAILEGRGPISNPFTKDKAGNYFLREGYKPDLEFWDGFKRSLDDQITSLDQAGRFDGSRSVKAVREQLLKHLDKAVPEFATAREGAAKAFAADNAFDAGLNFIGRKNAMGVAEDIAAFRKMSEPEQQLFREGVLRDLVQKVKTPDQGRDLTRMFNSAAMREKLAVVLGPQQAGELEAFTRIEQLMQASYRAVQGNSTTAQQASRMSWLGHKGPHGLPLAGLWAAGLPGGAAGVAIDYVLQKVLTAFDKRQAAAIAEKLVSKKPEDLQAVLTAIAGNPQAMDRLRQLTQTIVSAGSTAAARPRIPQERARGGAIALEDLPIKAIAEKVARFSEPRDVVRQLIIRRGPEILEGDRRACRAMVAAVSALPGNGGVAEGLATFLSTIHAAGKKRTPTGLPAMQRSSWGSGVPQKLRDQLGRWADGSGGRQLAAALTHPDAAKHLRQLNRSEFDSREWTAAISGLASLGGDTRQARAAGGAVERMNKAATRAKSVLAKVSEPLMTTPDEAIAAALRLAERK